MKTDNPHLFTEIFPPAAAISAYTTGLTRPDGIKLTALWIPAGNFMTEDPRENKITVALAPHFCIGAADGAAINCEDGAAVPVRRRSAVFENL
jgi:hypothetical protein